MGEGEEPSAEARTLARVVRDHFVALVHEGFTEQQAIALLGQMFAANASKPPKEEE